MRKTLVGTAAIALVLAPVLCSCSSSRRVRRGAKVACNKGGPAPMGALADAGPGPSLAPPPLPGSPGMPGGDQIAQVPGYDMPGGDQGWAPQPAQPPFPAEPMPGDPYAGATAQPAPAEGGWAEAPVEGMPSMPALPGESLGAAPPVLADSSGQNEQIQRQIDELRELRQRIKDDTAGSAPFHDGGAAPGVDGHMPVDQALASLETNLRAEARGTEVLRQGNQVVLRLTDAFAPGKDELINRSATESALRAAASALEKFPDARVSVVGHSDTTPIKHSRNRWSSNHHLSQARAQVVASRLTSAGVSQGRVQVTGLGATQPLVTPERTRSDRARNRRVEIVISL